MLRVLTSPRGRAAAVSAAGVALEAAVQLVFGAWQAWDALLALAVGMLVAVVAGALGGRVAGAIVGAAGGGLFAAYAAADVETALLTLPAWIVAGVVAGIASDLWTRARRERESERAKLRALDDAVPAALVTVAADETIAAWNGQAEAIFGLPSAEAIETPASVLGPDVGTLVERAREGEKAVEGQVAYGRDDGTELALLVRALGVGEGAVVLAAADVSDATRLESELRDVAARYDVLRRRIPVVTYAHPVGERDSLAYVSPQIERLLGYSPEDLTEGRAGLTTLVHPEDRARLEDELRALEAREPLRSEYRLLARDGRVVLVRDEATTVSDPAGRPLYVQGFLSDLSDRLEFERERERLALARSAAAADALARQHRLDFVVRAGDVLASSLGAEAGLTRVAELAVREFADWCVVDLVDDDGALSRLTAKHAQSIANGETGLQAPTVVPEPEVEAVAARGEPVVVPPIGKTNSGAVSDRPRETRILAPMLARGHVVGVLTFVRRASALAYAADDLVVAMDVARRAGLAADAESLHERVEREADAARVLTYVADGVFFVDRTGVIRLWNPAAQTITGLAASSMIGRRPADGIRDWERLRTLIPVASSTAPAMPRTIALEAEHGERWISISAAEFFGGTVYAFRDVTEAHRLDELKADFVTTASHELRTPLAAVYGAAQTLRRHDFALDESGRERFVSMIVEEADRLGRIVNEILLANQLDADRVEVAVEPFDARELLERVAEATRSHAPPEISLDIVVGDGPPHVGADRDKVRQVLVNLVDNAIKYSPDGGRIELGLEPSDGRVRFYVRDEGLGIPGDEQERIFEKFYRLDPTMTRGVGGTGLGLYICSQLVERMDGRIWVESSHGRGSTFAFELPAVDSA